MKKHSGLLQFLFWPTIVWFFFYFLKVYEPDAFIGFKAEVIGTAFLWLWWPAALVIVVIYCTSDGHK